MTETEEDTAILEVRVPKAKLHVKLEWSGSEGMQGHILHIPQIGRNSPGH